MASTDVAELYRTIFARPCGLALMYWFTSVLANTEADAVIVMLPATADGVIVPEGLLADNVKAYFGMLSNVIVLAVQLASDPPRTILTGCRSG